MELIELAKQRNVSLQVQPADLIEFGERLINQTMQRMAEEKTASTSDERLTAKEAAERLGISQNSLWRWGKSGYLRPVKVGRKSFYLLSDIEKIMTGRV